MGCELQWQYSIYHTVSRRSSEDYLASETVVNSFTPAFFSLNYIYVYQKLFVQLYASVDQANTKYDWLTVSALYTRLSS